MLWGVCQDKPIPDASNCEKLSDDECRVVTACTAGQSCCAGECMVQPTCDTNACQRLSEDGCTCDIICGENQTCDGAGNCVDENACEEGQKSCGSGDNKWCCPSDNECGTNTGECCGNKGRCCPEGSFFVEPNCPTDMDINLCYDLSGIYGICCKNGSRVLRYGSFGLECCNEAEIEVVEGLECCSPYHICAECDLDITDRCECLQWNPPACRYSSGHGGGVTKIFSSY